MEKLIVLDYATNSVLFIQPTKEQVKNFMENYEEEFDYESWIVDCGFDKKFGFNLDNCNWMLSDYMLSVYHCTSDGEMTNIHLNERL